MPLPDQVLGVSPTKSDGHVSQDDEEEPAESAPVEVIPEPVAEPEPEPEVVPEPEPVTESPPVEEEAPITIAEESSEQPSVADEIAEEPASDLDSSQAPSHLQETQPMEQEEQLPTAPTNQTHLSSATEESVSASATNASTEDVEMVQEQRTVAPIDEENDNAADVPEEKSTEQEPDSAMEVTDSVQKEDNETTTNDNDTESKNADEASQETTPADELAAKAEEAKKEEQRKDSGESRKRKRSRSPSPKRRTRTNSTAANTDDFTCVEDEPELDADKVTLSWFDSDLQLRISATEGFCEARPISDAAFGLVWAGARATHGVKVGQKVFYEVLLSQKNARVTFEQEKHLFNLRCGWSTQESELQLGEGALSFGFDGEGKKVRGGTAEDYGRAFEVDDVVGVYLDLQSDPCTVEYTLNGESLGVAFEVAQEELGESALFPHIISKNVAFKVNFGQLEGNLLTDLKAKPKKKEVVVVVKEVEKVVQEEAKVEEAKPEAVDEAKASEGETAAPIEANEEKPAEETTTPETATDAPSETTEGTSVEEQATPSAEVVEAEKKEEEVPASTEDVEMKADEEDQKPEGTEEEVKNDEEATTKPAEEVKEVAEEEEPLPEINRENLAGYIFIGLVAKEDLVAGPVRPESRKECEVIMMIGLSGAGKTKWVKEWVAEHPEKRYVVLGATALIDRMKVSGQFVSTKI